MILEECATIEEEDYNEVLLPQMNVARREVDGTLNPGEPSASQTFIKIVIKEELQEKITILCHYIEKYNRKPPELLETLYKETISSQAQ